MQATTNKGEGQTTPLTVILACIYPGPSREGMWATMKKRLLSLPIVGIDMKKLVPGVLFSLFPLLYKQSRLIWMSLIVGSIVSATLPETVKAEMKDSPKQVIDEVWQIVNHQFVDSNFNRIDWRKKREELLSRSYTSKAQAYKAIQQALKELGDPYTRFLPPEEFEALTSQTAGEISGIGIRIVTDPRTQELYIADVVKKSPAFQAGLKRGDRIVRIDGQPTVLMSLEKAQEALKGEIGTEVSLEVVREGRPSFVVKITRLKFEIPSLEFSLKREGEMKVGYIRLEEFNSHAVAQMRNAIRQLQKENPHAFVLDLRGNPGGLLFASVDIARLWLAKGEIVDIVDRQGGHQRYSANNSALTDLPLVVLVDSNSASASEILAAALKENKRAILVGTNTYGKGTVQSVYPLSDGSGLAVTISRYYPPSGTNINRRGIAPDIFQPLTREEESLLTENPSLMATSRDSQYTKAISVLQNLVSGKQGNRAQGTQGNLLKPL